MRTEPDTTTPDSATPLHVLVVEDDRDIARLVRTVLAEHAIKVSWAARPRQVDRVLQGQHVDLVLLDIMLPDEDGLSICRRLRAAPETAAVPVIVVSALGSEADRVRGLDIGADDYLVKPFGSEELLARIRAVLRRGSALRQAAQAAQETLEAGGLRLDLRRRALHGRGGARLMLTTTEFALLAIFMRQPQTVLSRDQISVRLHGRNAGPLDRAIDVAISRLRRKIEPDPEAATLIETVRNGGYVFTQPVRVVAGE